MPCPNKSSLKDEWCKPRTQALLSLVTALNGLWAPQSKPGTSSMISRTWHSYCQNASCIQAPVTLNGGHHYHLLLVFDSWLLFSECHNPLNSTESFNLRTKFDDFSILKKTAPSLLTRNVLRKIQNPWTVIDLFICQVHFRVVFLFKQQSGWLS